MKIGFILSIQSAHEISVITHPSKRWKDHGGGKKLQK